MLDDHASGQHPDRRGRSRPVALAVLSSALIAGALITALASDRQGGGQAGEQDGAQPVAGDTHGTSGAVRTVVVGSIDSTDLSTPDGPVMARRIRGAVPRATRAAVVLGDEDCAPDRKGVSHCLNELRLADGSKLTVRHNHRMSEVSCLDPGERVRVQPA